jgi:hypothetical protein
VQLVKTELQRSADAAARAGVASVPTDLSAARAQATQFAALNNACGMPVALDATADVEFGKWVASTKTFQPLSGSALSTADAIRVTARRTRARGNATPLVFASILGVHSCDTSASAVAYMRPPQPPMNVVGIGFIDLKGNDLIDSYNSDLGPYSASNSGSNVNVASNGNISTGGSSTLNGNAYTDSDSTISGPVSGTIGTLEAPLSYPPPVLPSTYTSHGAISLGGGKAMTLTAGNHYATSLNMTGNAELHVSGAVKLYIQGSLTIDGNASIAVAGDKPANLEIYVLGAGPVNLGKNDLFATIYAPLSPLYMNGNSDLFGSVVAASITMNGNNTIHYDTSLPTPASGPSRIVLVK